MRIIVTQLIGSRDCITPQDGQKLYEAVDPVLSGGSRVTLDFAGVDTVAPPFFNTAIGQLLHRLPQCDLERLLEIENLSGEAEQALRLVLKNSHRYFHDKDYRRAVDEVLEAASEDL